MSKVHQFFSYLSYWLHEENEHSLQAPFIYDLYQKVIKRKPAQKASYAQIEEIRNQFIRSHKTIEVSDYGSGSDKKSSIRAISQIASNGISQKKYSQFFDHLIDYLEATTIIELGTSLGINSLYLTTHPDRQLTTFEGASSLCAIAQAVFDGNNKSNIKLIEGNINETLPTYLENIKDFDVVFLDANHQYQPTLNYFHLLLDKAHDKTCFIFDDIHRSKQMELAWKEIKKEYEVTLTIDIYQVGIVFINPEIRKQNYILSF